MAEEFDKGVEIKEWFEAQHAEIHEVIQAYKDANPGMNVEDMIKNGIPLPKRLKQAEKAWGHMNWKAMRVEEIISTNFSLAKPAAKYRAGQSVHYYWSSWMSGAKAAPLDLNKKTRANWYVGEITNAPVWEEQVSYGGLTSTCWTYKTH